MKEIMKQNQKTQIRVFGHNYVYAYIGMCTQPSCMCTHTSSLRTHARIMCMHTHTQNPSLETRKYKKQS